MSNALQDHPAEPITMPDELHNRLRQAANLIIATSKPIKGVTHYDADGLSAGAIISATLLRLKKMFQISLQHSLDDDSKILKHKHTTNDSIKIFADMGSNQLENIEKYAGWSIILDHHVPKRDTKVKNVIHINSHIFGINGAYEISAASLAFLLSIQVSEHNWDLLPLALAGAIGDKQHKNGFKGLNLELVKTGLECKIITASRELKVNGNNILEALVRSTDPYFTVLSNNEPEVKKLLTGLQIDPGASVQELDNNAAQRLASYLVLKLMDQGIPPEDAEEFVTTRYFTEKYQIDIEELSHIINACGRMRQMGVGVAAGLGDQNAIELAKKLRVEYKQNILDGLKRLEKDGLEELENIQYFYEKTAEFAGTFAGIGMMYFFNQNKPVIALTNAKENINISGRGTVRLVNKGLDLAKTFAEISKEFNGSGGGHQIAAGAKIPLNKDKEFLNKVDQSVGEALGGNKKNASQKE